MTGGPNSAYYITEDERFRPSIANTRRPEWQAAHESLQELYAGMPGMLQNAARPEAVPVQLEAWEAEVKRGLELGLPAASSIEDRDIPTFSRGELPHFAGINTFMKAPYLEDVRRVGDYDATVMGVPFDGGRLGRSAYAGCVRGEDSELVRLAAAAA